MAWSLTECSKGETVSTVILQMEVQVVRGSRCGVKSLSADRKVEEILCQTLILLCGVLKCCTGQTAFSSTMSQMK